MPVKMILVSWGSSEHGGSWELHELSLEPCKECHTKILPGSEKKELSATAKQRYCQGLSKTKLPSVSITIKSTDRKCHD